MENRKYYNEFEISDKYRNQIDIWYRAYNIHREKVELFYDFLSSLYGLIDETYLGADVLYDETDQRDHFSWCWNKTIENFIREKIYFKGKGNHYEYFWNFFFEAYYLTKLDGKQTRIGEYFYKLFDFRYKKSRSELDILTEVYKLMEQNLKK